MPDLAIAVVLTGEEKVDAQIRQLTTALDGSITKLKAQQALLTDPAYKAAEEQQKKLREEVEKQSAKTFDLGSSWTSLASKYYLASQALGPLVRGFQSLLDATIEQDKMITRLNVIEHGAAGGAVALGKLIQAAKNPGLSMTAAVHGYSSLRSLRMEADKAMNTVNGLARANAAMGGGGAEFARVMTQISQMIGKGKVMAEDIQIISESMPNFRGIMMDAFGTTSAEAINAKMSVQQFIDKMMEATKNLPPAGDTIANNLDNLKDSWSRLKASLLDSDVVKNVTKQIGSLIEKMTLAREATKKEPAITLEAGRIRARQDQTGAALPSGIDLSKGQEFLASLKIQAAAIDSVNKSNAATTKAATTELGLYAQAAKNVEDRTNALAKAAKEQEEADNKKKKAPRSDKKEKAWKPEKIQTDADRGAEFVKEQESILAHHQDLRDKAAKKAWDETQKARKKEYDGQVKDAKHFADMEKKKSDDLIKELKKRQAAYDNYSHKVQGFAQTEVSSAIQGNFTMTNAKDAALTTMADMAAEYVTKSIEEMIRESVFRAEQATVDAATASAIMAASSAESAVHAAFVAAAWAPAAAATAAATWGASADAGAISLAAIYAESSALSSMPHARGGAIFGPALASREEAFIPLVPGRVVPAHNSTTNNFGGSTVQIHIHGGDTQRIKRTVEEAVSYRRATSR